MVTIEVLEYIGVITFAITGANIALKERFDLFGIYMMAAVTAMGGGVLRDTVIGMGVPAFFTSYYTLPFIFISATAVILLRGRIKDGFVFTALDAAGLAAFAVSAGLKTIDNGYNMMVVVFASCMTGVGGGMIRDIIVNRKPSIFKNDIYAVAAIIGGVVLLVFYGPIGRTGAAYFALFVTFATRMFCYVKNINLPTFKTLYGEEKESADSAEREKAAV